MTSPPLARMRSLRWLLDEVRWTGAHSRAAPQFRCRVCLRFLRGRGGSGWRGSG
jgi:hypothetical protein